MKKLFVLLITLLSIGVIQAQVELKTVKIGSQTWMNKNLNATTYRNGDPIPKVTDKTAWAELTSGAYCYYNNDSATYAAAYGKLYNYYAVNDPRGLAPKGWHVPSDTEWTTLSDFLGGASVAGGKMKETGTTHWMETDRDVTNSSGFTGLPGGYRDYFGRCSMLEGYGYWWSSTELSKAVAWNRMLKGHNGNFDRAQFNKLQGFSVRCMKD